MSSQSTVCCRGCLILFVIPSVTMVNYDDCGFIFTMVDGCHQELYFFFCHFTNNNSKKPTKFLPLFSRSFRHLLNLKRFLQYFSTLCGCIGVLIHRYYWVWLQHLIFCTISWITNTKIPSNYRHDFSDYSVVELK